MFISVGQAMISSRRPLNTQLRDRVGAGKDGTRRTCVQKRVIEETGAQTSINDWHFNRFIHILMRYCLVEALSGLGMPSSAEA